MITNKENKIFFKKKNIYIYLYFHQKNCIKDRRFTFEHPLS